MTSARLSSTPRGHTGKRLLECHRHGVLGCFDHTVVGRAGEAGSRPQLRSDSRAELGSVWATCGRVSGCPELPGSGPGQPEGPGGGAQPVLKHERMLCSSRPFGTGRSLAQTCHSQQFLGTISQKKTLALVSHETSWCQEPEEILRSGFVFTERPENLWDAHRTCALALPHSCPQPQGCPACKLAPRNGRGAVQFRSRPEGRGAFGRRPARRRPHAPA